jgi:hypothetical protein
MIESSLTMKKIVTHMITNIYNNQQEQEMGEEWEKEEWLDEYYRRQHDPYWKNDSDYD